MYYCLYDSPIGQLTLIGDENGLQALELPHSCYPSSVNPKTMEEKNDTPLFLSVKNWLDAYFNGKKPSFSDIRLNPQGNEFRQKVWKELMEIPYGKTSTYGEIAKKVASALGKERMSAQAVGGAISHNPVAILIPCHRVIGKSGSLTGYAGGLETKRKLLQLEGILQ